MPDVGLCAQVACLWEATARKPGNVDRFRDFADTSYLDFLTSAAAIGPLLTTAHCRRVGATVLACVRATQQVVARNTNLGIILLLTPLAAVRADEPLRTGVRRILAELDVDDARCVYEAIRLARPAGLGRVASQDVAEEPTQTLKHVMALAAERDLVARQYADDFATVFEEGAPALVAALGRTGSLEAAIIATQLGLMAAHPDSLIARKCGPAVALEAARRAGDVIAAGCSASVLADFDAWLRADGNARNPGTTADVVAACLFVSLREGTIPLPPRHPWLAELPP